LLTFETTRNDGTLNSKFSKSLEPTDGNSSSVVCDKFQTCFTHCVASVEFGADKNILIAFRGKIHRCGHTVHVLHRVDL